LSDEAYKLDNKIDNETTHRIRAIKEVNDSLIYELKQQEKMVVEFHEKAIEEFNHVANNIEKEMDNRFEHQDKIVDNLSNIVKTFQNTLKVIGSEP
jgi:SF-assemblin/beta giardin.